MIYVRDVLGMFVPMKLLVPLLLVVALLPGILLGLALSKLPRSLSLRCRACGWRETFRLLRPPPAPPVSSADDYTSPTDLDVESTIPAPPQPLPATESTDAGFPIWDDATPLAELRMWIRDAFLENRSAEEITADLCDQGWPPGDVETWVDQGRRAVRFHRR